MRVVIDTNIWISFLIGKSLDNLVGKIENTVTVLTCDEQLEELFEVLERPKLEKYFTPEKKRFLLHYLSRKAEWVKVAAHTDACRDKKDNYLLEMALSAEADCIVSGDEDLLVLDPFENIRIVNYSEFLSLLENT